MDGRMKFKPRQTTWTLFIVLLMLGLVILNIVAGEEAFETAFAVVNGLLVPIHLLVFFRTGNPGHLIATLYYGCLSLTFFMADGSVARNILAWITATFLVLFLYVFFKKSLNWRYREILELAARPVNESQDGYSGRPFPAGDGSFTRSDVVEFSRFLIRHVIAFPFVEEKRVVLVIPRNMFRYLILFERDYRDDTHVIFDFSGQVTVFMSRKDYQQYVEEWTFDKLCQSLGDLFKTFLTLYKQGKGREILRILNRFRSEAFEIRQPEQEAGA